MYAQCPECLTIYKLGAAELAGSHGSVRCGHCAAVFDALRTLTDQLPPEPITQLEEIPAGGAPPQLTVPALRPVSPRNRARCSTRTNASAYVPRAPARRPLRRVRRCRRSHARAHVAPIRRNWPWAAGAFVLLLTLGAQIGYAERSVILDDRTARPLLERICDSSAAACRCGTIRRRSNCCRAKSARIRRCPAR